MSSLHMNPNIVLYKCRCTFTSGISVKGSKLTQNDLEFLFTMKRKSAGNDCFRALSEIY